jgi:hypothetical protein
MDRPARRSVPPSKPRSGSKEARAGLSIERVRWLSSLH